MSKPLLIAAPLALFAALAAFAAEPPVTATPPSGPPPVAPIVTPPVTPAAGPRTFAIDAKKSSVVIQVFKDGAAAALAHDHVVEARDLSGTIVGDGVDATTAKVEVTAQTASFINDDTKMRTKYGLDGEISEKDRKAVEENMKSKDQLDIKGFPTVKFSSTSVTKAADGKLTLNGKLTLHGVTKDVTMPVDVKMAPDSLSGTATFRAKTSDYGIKPYSALLGAVKNKDEIVIHLHLVANAK
ncbi:MAG: YceI family protein [Deltaproteobacteria bacterium]|nr:YceI family protein [Deltaproteobacteria bacterium]